MNIDEGASLELVNNFCYLGDMLSVDGYADVAMGLEYDRDVMNLGNLCFCLATRTFPFLCGSLEKLFEKLCVT